MQDVFNLSAVSVRRAISRAAATASVCAALIGAAVALPNAAAAACRADLIDIRGPGVLSRFVIELAETPEARARGLMFREHLNANAGMLFVFDPPQPVAFWMRNTPLPLDIIFIDPRGVIANIAANTVPFSETPLPSNGAVSAVLEINGGLAAQLGIGSGSQVRHPAFTGAAPLWPCDQ